MRPDHLFLGTPKQNTADMAAKGREHFPPPGEGHPTAILTEADVFAIRAARQQGVTGAALGRQYGVHRSTVYKICSGKSWAHSIGPVPIHPRMLRWPVAERPVVHEVCVTLGLLVGHMGVLLQQVDRAHEVAGGAPGDLVGVGEVRRAAVRLMRPVLAQRLGIATLVRGVRALMQLRGVGLERLWHPPCRHGADVGEDRLAELEVPCQGAMVSVDDLLATVGAVRSVDEDRRFGVLAAPGDLGGEAVYGVFLMRRRPLVDVVVINAGPGNMDGPDAMWSA